MYETKGPPYQSSVHHTTYEHAHTALAKEGEAIEIFMNFTGALFHHAMSCSITSDRRRGKELCAEI